MMSESVETVGNSKTILSRALERARVAEDKIENAAQAMAETSPSWEARCHSIMAALGLDFGGPTPDIPEQDSWYAMNLKRAEDRAFEAQMQMASMADALGELLYLRQRNKKLDWEKLSDSERREWIIAARKIYPARRQTD